MSGRPNTAEHAWPGSVEDPGLTPTATAAAQALDLSGSRRLVHIGGDADVPAAFLRAWPQLGGVWVGPASAQAEAQRGLARHALQARLQYQARPVLDASTTGDLVVLSAIDAAVEDSLQLLASAGPGWLPAAGRWLILQRRPPHLSCVIGPALLQAQGLRIASRWTLPAEVQMLVCAPVHRFAALLAAHGDHTPPNVGTAR